MTIARRSSPLGELISLRQAMDSQIRITPTDTSSSNGSNGSRNLAPGETSARTTTAAGA